MCTNHIVFNKNQRYMFWKYNGFICKLYRRRKTHYWSLQAGNRLAKKEKNIDDIRTFEMVRHIFRNKQK